MRCSVGDVNFRKKSYARLKEMINQEDKTVLIVSHNSNTIRELCSHAVWLNDGILKMTGEVNEVVDAYEDFMSKETEKKRLQKEAAKKK